MYRVMTRYDAIHGKIRCDTCKMYGSDILGGRGVKPSATSQVNRMQQVQQYGGVKPGATTPGEQQKHQIWALFRPRNTWNCRLFAANMSIFLRSRHPRDIIGWEARRKATLCERVRLLHFRFSRCLLQRRILCSCTVKQDLIFFLTRKFHIRTVKRS